MLPAWQYSADPSINYKISTSPGMMYPDGVYQTTTQPIGPYYNPPPPTLGDTPSIVATAPDDNTTLIASLIGWGTAIAAGYHGYKRNDSLGWAIGWAAFPMVLGLPLAAMTQPSPWLGLLPDLAVLALAFSQGFAKPKMKSKGKR